MKSKPMIESHTGRETPDALRKRLDETGYLFFRNFLDPGSLLALRKEVLGICQKHGWLLPGSELIQGKGRPDAYSGWFESTGVYKDIQLLERLHAMAQHPKIIDTLATIFDDAVFPHPRNIMRVTTPGSVALTTPSHQDYVFIQGSQNFYTVWFPLSVCPRELGGLAIAPGTHKHGIYPTKQAGGTGGLCIDADDDRFEWHASDFRFGDAIMFIP